MRVSSSGAELLDAAGLPLSPSVLAVVDAEVPILTFRDVRRCCVDSRDVCSQLLQECARPASVIKSVASAICALLRSHAWSSPFLLQNEAVYAMAAVPAVSLDAADGNQDAESDVNSPRATTVTEVLARSDLCDLRRRGSHFF